MDFENRLKAIVQVVDLALTDVGGIWENDKVKLSLNDITSLTETWASLQVAKVMVESIYTGVVPEEEEFLEDVDKWLKS